jgi:hypothetical protein
MVQFYMLLCSYLYCMVKHLGLCVMYNLRTELSHINNKNVFLVLNGKYKTS